MAAGSASHPSSQTHSGPSAPTTQQLEVLYPEWAISESRLNFLRARIVAKSERLGWEEARDTIVRIIARLEEEGPTPVWDDMLKYHPHPMRRPAYDPRYQFAKDLSWGFTHGAGVARLGDSMLPTSIPGLD